MSNIYYNPEHFGLEIVAEIEYSSGSYEFDTRVVWKEKDGRKCYTMRDSGCSCPTPFESYNLSNVELLDIEALRREVNEEVLNDYRRVSQDKAQEFLSKVKAAANNRLHRTGLRSASASR